jgi:hypothetical protein
MCRGGDRGQQAARSQQVLHQWCSHAAARSQAAGQRPSGRQRADSWHCPAGPHHSARSPGPNRWHRCGRASFRGCVPLHTVRPLIIRIIAEFANLKVPPIENILIYFISFFGFPDRKMTIIDMHWKPSSGRKYSAVVQFTLVDTLRYVWPSVWRSSLDARSSV